ncbi:MAG TPA: M48 family metalloprotease [Methylomirabilota bacterium]|nr:M48 family metalloprotease [Methylomirabilota bacterium]
MRRRASGFIALVLALVLVGCQSGGGGVTAGHIFGGMMGVNPTDVRGATADIDEPEEIELGRSVATALGSRYKLMRDEPLTRYVALVGNSVALQSDRPDLKYYFGVLDSDEINAFAAPGGYIFITRGTLAVMRDEATLAGVLGHEIGHIALRHHNETIKDQKKAAVSKGIGTTALQIGSGFIPGVGGAVTSGVVNSPLMNLAADGLVNAALKGFSRAEEEQADMVGYKYAAKAGYDPAGLRDFLKAVQDTGTQPAKTGLFEKWGSTHPGGPERLKEQENQLKTLPPGGRRAAARFETAMASLGQPAAKPPAGQPATKPPAGQPATKPPAQPTR